MSLRRLWRSSAKEGHIDAIDRRFLDCIEFIDDKLWCERTGAELDIEHLRLEGVSRKQDVSVRLRVEGIEAPLEDPRVPRVIVALRRYRRCKGVAIFSERDDWRLALTAANELSYMNKSNDAPAEDYALIPEGAIEDLALRSESVGQLFSVAEVA